MAVREPPVGLLGADVEVTTRAAVSPRRRWRPAVAAALVVGLVAVSGCSPSTPSDEPVAPTETPSTTSSTGAVEPPDAAKAMRPRDDACYRLSLAQAIAPTTDAAAVPCRRRWTSHTIRVGTMESLAGGYALPVDSDLLQRRLAETCPRQLARYLGGTPAQVRLTVFSTVWFTPTMAEAEAGADWYRCDLVALARPGVLARLTGRWAGALADPERLAPYSLCGTTRPGARGFAQVACRRAHTWRAVGTVNLFGREYPGRRAARLAGEERCREAARQSAADALDFDWGYEWPTAAQWRGVDGQPGRRYGVCWARADGG